MADYDARTLDKLQLYLKKVVVESINSVSDPSNDERAYQQAVAKSITDAGETSRIKGKSAPKKVAKQMEPHEAEEDDIFADPKADQKKDTPKKDKGASAPAPAEADKSAQAPRQNRNSPEAAKFSLADAQDQAHAKEQAASKIVPTPRPEDLTFDMVVTALNIMRSGQSLKDQRVRQEVETYFNNLQGAERTALYSYLNGLAQIVAANVPSAQAPSPDDSPNPINMEFASGSESDDGKKRSDGPRREKQQDSGNKRPKSESPHEDKKEKSDEVEDTAPPISVGPREGKRHSRNLV